MYRADKKSDGRNELSTEAKESQEIGAFLMAIFLVIFLELILTLLHLVR